MPFIVEVYQYKDSGELLKFKRGADVMSFHTIVGENPKTAHKRSAVFLGYMLFMGYSWEEACVFQGIHRLSPEFQELLRIKEGNLIESHEIDVCLELTANIVAKMRTEARLRIDKAHPEVMPKEIELTDPEVIKIAHEKQLALETKLKLYAFYGWKNFMADFHFDLCDPKYGLIDIIDSMENYINIALGVDHTHPYSVAPHSVAKLPPSASAAVKCAIALPPADGVFEQRLIEVLQFMPVGTLKHFVKSQAIAMSTLEDSEESFLEVQSLVENLPVIPPSAHRTLHLYERVRKAPSLPLSADNSPVPSPSFRPATSSLEAYKSSLIFGRRLASSGSSNSSPAKSPVVSDSPSAMSPAARGSLDIAAIPELSLAALSAKV